MTLSGPSSPLAALIRAWRTQVACLTQQDVATRISLNISQGLREKPASTQSISAWELGTVVPTPVRLASLDTAFQAGGTFLALAKACRTPMVFPAREVWRSSIPGGVGPVWAWIRPTEPGSVRGWVQYALFGLPLDEVCDAGGIFVCSPVSAPTPTVVVTLDSKGWVNFGRGVIPPVLGIPIVDGLQSQATHSRLLSPRVILQTVYKSLHTNSVTVDREEAEHLSGLARAEGFAVHLNRLLDEITPRTSEELAEVPSIAPSTTDVPSLSGPELAVNLRNGWGLRSTMWPKPWHLCGLRIQPAAARKNRSPFGRSKAMRRVEPHECRTWRAGWTVGSQIVCRTFAKLLSCTCEEATRHGTA